MEILVVGLSLGSAKLAHFEALHRVETLDRIEARLRAIAEVREIVRVVTCHRIEWVIGLSRPVRRTSSRTARRSLPTKADEQHVAAGSPVAAIRHADHVGPLGAAVRHADDVRPLAPSVRQPDGGGSLAAAVRVITEIARRLGQSAFPSHAVAAEESAHAPGKKSGQDMDAIGASHQPSGSGLEAGAPSSAVDAGIGVYAVSGAEAFRHLLRVATGLESPLRGESEILGQLRAAYADAVERGASGPILNPLFHRLFRAARRLRARSGLETSPTSPNWSEFLADAIVPGYELSAGDSLHLLGSGRLSCGLALSLRARGVIVIEVRGPDIRSELTGARTIVTASGRGRILGAEDLGLLPGEARSGREIAIWDLGMPRNVDAAVADVPGVRLRTLADLESMGPGERAGSRPELEIADNLVEAEVEDFASWRRDREPAASIVRLGGLLETPALESLDGNRGKEFRRRLLGAIVALAEESADEEEASARLAMFETVLRRASRPESRRAGPRRDTPRAARRESGSGLVEAEMLFERNREMRTGPKRTEVEPFVTPGRGKARRMAGASSSGTARTGTSRERTDSARRGVTAGRGRVSLVGAGPGDPGLLTLRGAERLAEADVVYYDALVARETLAHCRPDAKLVDVGKRRGAASASQEEIEAALIHEVHAGHIVVRLKGGDPFVFGRGGEEALALLREGIACEVVPGVTAGTAVPALAGIPLTHRGLSSSAAFLTAHDLSRGGGGAANRRRLGHLSRGAETLVLFMAGTELTRAKETLLEAGMPGDVPAALIESGTTPAQRIDTATLAELDSLAADRGEGPVLVVIGWTVALSETLRHAGVSSEASLGDPAAHAAQLGTETGSDRLTAASTDSPTRATSAGLGAWTIPDQTTSRRAG